MNKPLLSRALVVAAVVAAAGVGVAQAETFNTPMQAGEASTMTHGQPNMRTTNTPSYSYSYDVGGPLPAPVVDSTILGAGPMSDTTVLGAGPMVTYEATTVYPSSVYVQPSTSWDHSYYDGAGMGMGGATATSPIPDRAGEASTIVNGVPNRLP